MDQKLEWEKSLRACRRRCACRGRGPYQSPRGCRGGATDQAASCVCFLCRGTLFRSQRHATGDNRFDLIVGSKINWILGDCGSKGHIGSSPPANMNPIKYCGSGSENSYSVSASMLPSPLTHQLKGPWADSPY